MTQPQPQPTVSPYVTAFAGIPPIALGLATDFPIPILLGGALSIVIAFLHGIVFSAAGLKQYGYAAVIAFAIAVAAVPLYHL